MPNSDFDSYRQSLWLKYSAQIERETQYTSTGTGGQRWVVTPVTGAPVYDVDYALKRWLASDEVRWTRDVGYETLRVSSPDPMLECSDSLNEFVKESIESVSHGGDSPDER